MVLFIHFHLYSCTQHFLSPYRKVNKVILLASVIFPSHLSSICINNKSEQTLIADAACCMKNKVAHFTGKGNEY